MDAQHRPEAPSGDLLDALVQTSFDVIGIVSRVAAAHDLSLTQLRLIAILRDREPTLSQLADHLGLDRSTISGLIDRAAARGLVERVANPADRRSARVALTAAPQTRRNCASRAGLNCALRSCWMRSTSLKVINPCIWSSSSTTSSLWMPMCSVKNLSARAMGSLPSSFCVMV